MLDSRVAFFSSSLFAVVVVEGIGNKEEGLPCSACLGASPKLSEGAMGALSFSLAFVNLNPLLGVVLGPGAEAEDAKGGALSPVEPSNLFCDPCDLALILAIAAASKSCFSHFENVLLKVPFCVVGLSPPPEGGRGMYALATRRLVVDA